MLPAILSLLSMTADPPPTAEFLLQPPRFDGSRWVYGVTERGGSPDADQWTYRVVTWSVDATQPSVGRSFAVYDATDEERPDQSGGRATRQAQMPLSAEPVEGAYVVDATGHGLTDAADRSDPVAGIPIRVPPGAETVEAAGQTWTVAERDRLTLVPAGKFRCLVLVRTELYEGRTREFENRVAEGVGLVQSRTRLLGEGRPTVLSETELIEFEAAPSPPLTDAEIAALPAELYPTAVGTTWRYTQIDRSEIPIEVTPSQFIIQITKRGELDGRPAWMTELRDVAEGGLFGQLVARIAGTEPPPIVGWETYDPTVPGYIMQGDDASAETDTPVISSPELFAFWPPRVGATFKSDGGVESVTDVRRETVVTPAGVFECVRVETQFSGPNDQTRSVGYWTPGVGQVRYEMFGTGEAAVLEQTLVHFRAGADD